MTIRAKYLNLFLIILIVIIGAKCDNDRNSILGVPVTDYYDSCSFYDYSFGDMATFSDPNDKFNVRLPYAWDVTEQYSDSVYGIIAGNFMSIPIEDKGRMSFMISGYSTDLLLEKYYLNELKTLKADSKVELLETGKTFINGIESYWVKFSSNDEVFHLVVYIKHPKSEDLYLLQGSVYYSEKYDVRLCYLKQIIDSFEITDTP